VNYNAGFKRYERACSVFFLLMQIVASTVICIVLFFYTLTASIRVLQLDVEGT
jgi:hypothetical protein